MSEVSCTRAGRGHLREHMVVVKGQRVLLAPGNYRWQPVLEREGFRPVSRERFGMSYPKTRGIYSIMKRDSPLQRRIGPPKMPGDPTEKY